MPAVARRFCTRWTLCSAGVTLLLAGLIAAHQRPFNGPPFYPWPFVTTPAARVPAIGAIVAAHVAICWLTLARVPGLARIVTILCVASLGLRLGISATLSEPFGLADAAASIRDQHVGSYFTAAEMVGRVEWTLRDYPGLMPQLPLHAQNKPPGPMLFWTAMLAACGDADRAARVGAVVVAMLAALAVPMSAVAARVLALGDRSARHVAAITSLLPGTIVFFPLFDPAYLTWSLVMIATWSAALRGNAWWAVAFGATVAATFFFAVHLLPIGLFLGLTGIAAAIRARSIDQFATRSVIAVVVALAGLVAMHLVAGYDALATLRVGLEQQAQLQRTFGDKFRPYPDTIPWDLYDAALGVGFAPAILAVAALFGGRRVASIAACGLATWAIVAVASLLPTETSRVWIFLFPLVTLPAGAIVARSSRGARLSFYIASGAVLFALATRLLFVSAAPVIDAT